jgi:hypothetical protein
MAVSIQLYWLWAVKPSEMGLGAISCTERLLAGAPNAYYCSLCQPGTYSTILGWIWDWLGIALEIPDINLSYFCTRL